MIPEPLITKFRAFYGIQLYLQPVARLTHAVSLGVV